MCKGKQYFRNKKSFLKILRINLLFNGLNNELLVIFDDKNLTFEMILKNKTAKNNSITLAKARSSTDRSYGAPQPNLIISYEQRVPAELQIK